MLHLGVNLRAVLDSARSTACKKMAPASVLLTGSALGDAARVFLVPVLALLRFAFVRVSKFVCDLV